MRSQREEHQLKHMLFTTGASKARYQKLSNHWKELWKADTIKLETVARVATGHFLALILSIAHLPSIVPPSFSMCVAILMVCFFAFPKVLFSILGCFPNVMVSTLVVLALATMS